MIKSASEKVNVDIKSMQQKGNITEPASSRKNFHYQLSISSSGIE